MRTVLRQSSILGLCILVAITRRTHVTTQKWHDLGRLMILPFLPPPLAFVSAARCHLPNP